MGNPELEIKELEALVEEIGFFWKVRRLEGYGPEGEALWGLYWQGQNGDFIYSGTFSTLYTFMKGFDAGYEHLHGLM